MFSALNEILSGYLPAAQVMTVRDAYQFAAKAHKAQQRSSGESYITHPLAVATILAQMHMDVESIVAAILHDVLEDTHISQKVMRKKFGSDVTKLVDGVSKLTQIEFESRAEAQAENFRKMVMAMADDIRVILIKLADRLHNMRTLHHLPREKQRRIAKETLEIYAPIANRLGMRAFRLEFEELGFAACYPLRYNVLKEAVKLGRGHRREIISKIHESVDNALSHSELTSYRLFGREKHLYSLYRKMRQKRLRFSEVMDIYAFRVIVSDQDECYRVLGIVHNLYKPIPRHFKDYIAIPKANGYQSVHTVLFGPFGVPVEIQIRTEEMDKIAENGIAAHWLYKTDEGVVNKAQVRAREWIKGLLEIQRNAGNSLEFIENVKIDLFPDEVYVFTPQGQIMALPNGATPIDFAYKIHSDIGDHCVSAKIDRKLSPLSECLRNGQTVEIVVHPNASPSPAWLNFVVTGKARSRIRQFLKQQRYSESLELGKRLLEYALLSYHMTLNDIPKANIKKALKALHCETMDELLESIGLGNQIAQLVAHRLIKREMFEIAAKSDKKLHEPLRIKGSEGVVINFAKCCRPIPGDPIEGVITTGRGITVHHDTCKNLLEFRDQPDKCIPLCWEDDVQGDFEVELQVEIINERGVLAEIALTVAEEEANINNVSIHTKDGKYSTVPLLIGVRNREHLSHIVRHLLQIRNVTKVVRYQNT